MLTLTSPVTDAGRSMKMYASRLANLNIATLEDFLYHVPSRYEDHSQVVTIKDAKPGEDVTIQGMVKQIKNTFTRSRKQLQQAVISDDTGEVHVMWFNQPFITKTIIAGSQVALSGRIEEIGFPRKMISPDYEVISPNTPLLHTGRLVPIYPETKGVSSKWLRRQIYTTMTSYKSEINEYLPSSLLTDLKMEDLPEALNHLHFPTTLEEAQKARDRLAFDEMLLLEMGAEKRKSEWKAQKQAPVMDVDMHQAKLEALWNSLPFTLTNAQMRVIHEILRDVHTNTPMNRLLLGDVGSGKTVVAAIIMYLAYLNGYQSALMAPTEILAQQHFETISRLLSPLGLHVVLQTGSVKGLKKTSEKPDILIGTHAILTDGVDFDRLGFIVIDEQQRFGVEQRGKLKSKGINPHLLSMTATPIPRTVALTVYGDLDLSVIDEMPLNRQEIKTWLVPNSKRDSSYTWIQKQIQESGDQAFVICPFIEPSESMTTVKAVTEEYEKLKKIFTSARLGLLHGRMKSKEKEQILLDFRARKFDILVATPVVEVGIDIPNATIMLVEAADRFGLAQLHQLRGRVGRGEKKSYCLLFTESDSQATRERLRALESIHSGPRLAELDLEIRGGGDIYGTAQSGHNILKVASFSDIALIERAKTVAEKLYPDLEKYPELKKKVEDSASKAINPD